MPAKGFWHTSGAPPPLRRTRRTVPTPTPSLRAICRSESPCLRRAATSSRRNTERGRPLAAQSYLLQRVTGFLPFGGSRTGGDVQRRSFVENVPGQAEQHSGAARKPFGFGPDSCSPSARNSVRNQRGILFGFTPESRSPCPGFRNSAQKGKLLRFG